MQTVTDNEQRSRFELRVDDELAGWLDYRPAGASIIIVDGFEISVVEYDGAFFIEAAQVGVVGSWPAPAIPSNLT